MRVISFFSLTVALLAAVGVSCADKGNPVADVDVITCAGAHATFPGKGGLPTITALPDPFEAMDGTRITRKDQWACRRDEIAA